MSAKGGKTPTTKMKEVKRLKHCDVSAILKRAHKNQAPLRAGKKEVMLKGYAVGGAVTR